MNGNAAAHFIGLSLVMTEKEAALLQGQLLASWLLYGQVHLTNANGVSLLDPRGIVYRDYPSIVSRDAVLDEIRLRARNAALEEVLTRPSMIRTTSTAGIPKPKPSSPSHRHERRTALDQG